MAIAATAQKIAWLSTCAPATSTCRSRGFSVHSSPARNWRSRLPRVSVCSSSPVPANAASPSRDSTKAVSRAESPPIHEASAWPPLARLP